jgi:hypothetical protein
MIITADGRPLPADSDELNHYYHRTSRDEGSKLAPIEAGLLQQFPNDGFLVETKLARQIPLQTRDKVGDMCDMDFGVRLGPIAKRFYFVNQFTAKYRLTSGLTLSANVTPAHLFRRLDEYPVPAESEWGRDAALSRLAPQAVVEYVNLGERKKAMQLYMSKHHPLRRRCPPEGCGAWQQLFSATRNLKRLETTRRETAWRGSAAVRFNPKLFVARRLC